MSARKFGGSWWIDFSFDQVRYRKKSPENSRVGANAYELLLRGRLARGENIEARHVTAAELEFRTFAEKWFEDYVVPNNKPSEQKAKSYILTRSLVPFFGRTSLDRISANDVERYKLRESRRGTSNKTINNKLAVLRKCLASAWEWHGLHGAPPKMKPLKFAPAKTDFLTMDECERLLAHAEGVVFEMILLALRTGMRQGEIRGLQWESIDWENRILAVRHSLCDYGNQLTTPKSNRERYVPLADEVYPLLAARRQSAGYVFQDSRGRPFSGQVLLTHLKRIQHAAGLRDFGWHTLRHTFASQLAVNGVPLRVVQELLGHSTITMTMRYSHVAPGNLRAAIRTLGPASPQSTGLGNGQAMEPAASQKKPANSGLNRAEREGFETSGLHSSQFEVSEHLRD